MPSSRRLLTLLVALVVAVAAAPAALAWDEGSFSAGSESQLVTLQNQARASGGRKTLKQDAALRTIARWRSKDMAQRDYFSHTIPGPGADHNVFWYMQHEYGYCFQLAGENIGNATWPGASEEDVTAYVFDLFMDSDGHRRNIMGRDWDVVAVGAYRTNGDHYLWTVLFADRCGGGGGGGGGDPDPTPKPKPKPTPKPKPRPTDRPDPTERARPRDTPKPEPRPAREPNPVREPRAERTFRPERSPESRPTPEPTPTPAPTPLIVYAPVPTPTLPPTPSPTPTPTAGVPASWNGGSLPANGLRVMDPPEGPGLIDSILSTVTAQFFGS